VAASAAAALVHAALAPGHAGGGGLAVAAFLAAGAAQLALPLVALARGGPWWKVVAAVHVGSVIAYVAAVLGLAPLLHEGPEAVSALGLVTVALEVTAAITALRARAAPAPWGPVPAAMGAALVAVAAVAVGLAPSHSHSAGGHDHAGAELTAEQRARAEALIAGTATALRDYTDVAAAEAAGYRWIGDGAEPGGYRHYVHGGRLTDPVVLDPAQVESLVYRTRPDGGAELVSAMYILPPGRGMTDVPDVAGELTAWHDHTNLCWRRDRTLAGTVGGSGCPSGSRALPTPPMLHVWVVPHVDGPFAGIEGHGGDHHAGTHGG
jgi:hypothetical protein